MSRSDLVDVTVRIRRGEPSTFDQVVEALERAGLTDLARHPRFHMVSGRVRRSHVSELSKIEGVVSVRADRDYRAL